MEEFEVSYSVHYKAKSDHMLDAENKASEMFAEGMKFIEVNPGEVVGYSDLHKLPHVQSVSKGVSRVGKITPYTEVVLEALEEYVEKRNKQQPTEKYLIAKELLDRHKGKHGLA